jgi:hypothetical protein
MNVAALLVTLQLATWNQATPRFTLEVLAGLDGPAGTGPAVAGSVALGQRWSFGIASALVPPDGPLPIAAFLRARLASRRRLNIHAFSGLSQERRLTGGTYRRPHYVAETYQAGWHSSLRANAGIGVGVPLGPVALQGEVGLGYLLGISSCSYFQPRDRPLPPIPTMVPRVQGSCSNRELLQPFRHEPRRWVPFASGAVVLPLGTVATRAHDADPTADQSRRWELLGLELHPVGVMVNRQGLEDQVSRSLTLRIATLLRPRWFVSPISGIYGVAGQVEPALAGVFAEAGAVIAAASSQGTFRIGGGLGAGMLVLGGGCAGMCIHGAPVLATTSVQYLVRMPSFDLGLVARALMGVPARREGSHRATVAVLLGLAFGLMPGATSTRGTGPATPAVPARAPHTSASR